VIWALSAVIIIQGIVIFKLLAGKKIKQTKPIEKAAPMIAIVIDDWGYNLNNLNILARMNYPITCAILPNLNYSINLIRDIHKFGKETILHLPLEPHEKFRLEKNTILTTMDENQIIAILGANLDNIPELKGVSNHMGSLATEDPRIMGIVLRELKKRGLYFLDSLVSAHSISKKIAVETGIAFAKRDIFLDNLNEAPYIKQQFHKLKQKASLYGNAIGIGHDRRITLSTLAELIPEAQKEGFEFVFVSDLAK
ncbi:MAG: divergent polysaccharide deacetylase family protein, partial [Candidatus Omnitrophica bacterium]|nr:divergent polysaccharide deacetylase family protein [Candidatus Omnitrophota bacterium]